MFSPLRKWKLLQGVWIPRRSEDDAQAPAASTPPRGPRRSRIHVRRFAGHASYVERLPHLRIAHLTDQHVGRVTPYEVQLEAVELTNAEKPDLVCLTGDFVCHSQLYLDQLEALIKRFEAPVVAVLGNHDHWAGGGEVVAALRAAGAEVLNNRHTMLTLRGERLQVVGLDDAYTGHAHRDQAVKGLRHDVPALGLSHIAEEADGLWHHGIPLVLSGHTHGGQVTVARLHELALGKLVGHKYVHGLYGTRASPEHLPGPHRWTGDGSAGRGLGAVYVGAGIGAAVMPLRIGERGQREVTIFELGQAPGSFDEHHDEQPALEGRKPSARKLAKRHAVVVKKREQRAERRTVELRIKR